MSEILTKPYEISVWEDRLVEEDGEYKFEEVKLAVIGSNTMTGLNKVYDPVFNKKSNGERTLTFSLKYKYFDPYSENDNIVNPFAALLVNERKVKLKYDGEWYEFIVKDHSESSEEYTWTYTCSDAFVLELSKQGYNITFDTELNNNQGTARELAKETLKDTDWQLGTVDVGRQMVAEPIYLAQLIKVENIDIIDVDTGESPDPGFQSGLDIYLFYSYVANKNGKFVQFILRNPEQWAVVDSKNIITATNYRIITELTYNEENKGFTDTNGDTVIALELTDVETKMPIIETQYQANRLAYGQLNTYDPVMGRTVDRFSVDGGDLEVYKYTDYTYTTSNVVINYMTNGDNFNALEDGTLQGWNPYTDQEFVYAKVTKPEGNPQEKGYYEKNNDEYVLTTDTEVVPGHIYYEQKFELVNQVELTTKPKLATGQKLVDLSVLSQIQGFLQAKFNGPRIDKDNKIYNTIYNSGIDNHLSLIESIAQGDKFVFRWRAGAVDTSDKIYYKLTTDTKVIENKDYYEKVNDNYSKVTPASDDNPKEEQWYEITTEDLDRLISCSDLGLILAKYTSDEPTRFGYYYKHINPNDIIATFELEGDPANSRLNNYVKGGYLRDNAVHKKEYVIGGIVQDPSTKYIYVNDTQEDPQILVDHKNYVWNGMTGDFEELAEDWSNYLPYYYVVAEATRAVSNTRLKSVDANYGLFLYTTEDVSLKEVVIDRVLAEDEVEPAKLSKKEVIDVEAKWDKDIELFCPHDAEQPTVTFVAGASETITQESFTYTYDADKATITIAVSGSDTGIRSYKIKYKQITPIYIQDIQFTRFIPDEDGVKPIIIGNVPEATSNSKDYYYVKPTSGMTAEDIVLSTSVEEIERRLSVYTKTSDRTVDPEKTYYIYDEDSNEYIRVDNPIDADLDLYYEQTSQAHIAPLYNEDSEKYLTITAAQSNCFNVLQTIAETFECWVELEADHDEIGRIRIDPNSGLPRKFVNLREYIGKDNYAGFKYGINLNTIERTVNSEEFVTKLIVDQSQCEYVDEGFISIASAPSNPSKESYILNFEYYYSQGLLDRTAGEADRTSFLSEINEINSTLNEKEAQRRNLEASLTSLGSNRNVYSDLIRSAQDMKNDALADFQRLTNETYDEYKEKHGVLVDGEDVENEEHSISSKVETVELDKYPSTTKIISISVPFWPSGAQTATCTCGTKSHIDNSGNLIDYDGNETFVFTTADETTITENSKALFTYTGTDLKQLTDDQTIYDVLGEIYTSSATINNYSGLLTNVNQEYDKIHEQLYGYLNYNVKIWVDYDKDKQRHLYIEVNDYLVGFKFQLDNDETIYEVTTSKKYFDISPTDATTITFTAPENYTVVPSDIYEIDDYQVTTYKIICDQTKTGVIDEIEEIREQKNALIKAFNTKYSRFIQEGTWNSTDYIDSEKYYLDALQVSNTSAEPVVSYTINVVEISQLEGYEWYDFDAGDKSYVEDTEFFGWELRNIGTKNNPNYVPTPVKEEVIVSEVEWHLDEPDQNTITVQNYKTRFEDLFQRVNATVQTVQYNEATYAKTSTLMDANGMLNPSMLLSSLNNISGQRYSLTSDGSVVINGDEILVQDLQNPQNYVIINSNGIEISSDGDVSRRKAVDGRGINVGTVYTGTLNTDNVIIGNENSPSFRWDKSGISAYELPENSTDAYNLQTFVRFDQYGLYGIKDNASFVATDLNDVIDNAHFAVTWNGFFIKNSYEGGGRVEITSDNDFRVLNTVNGVENEKIKIGALEWGDGITSPDAPGATSAPTLYGIRILDDSGQWVMKTGDDGSLDIRGHIEAISANFSQKMTVGKNNSAVQTWITIDGRYADIHSSDYFVDEDGTPRIETGRGWIIKQNGDAIFNNITARGAIKTAVFEYAEIEAVGGSFLFRPSSTIRSAERDLVNTSNIIVTVEKPDQFSTDHYCKVSNYSGGVIGSCIYKISKNNNEITLIGAATEMLDGSPAILADVNDLIGGALIDLGTTGNNSNNYAIGINSSTDAIQLPPQCISLFKSKIEENEENNNNFSISYEYGAILGTLPSAAQAGISVDTNIYSYMANKQGIYTDNMYIGDADKYVAFYKNNQGGHLKVKGDIEATALTIAPEGSSDLSYTVVINADIQYENGTATLTATPYYQGEPTDEILDYLWYQDSVEDGEDIGNTNILQVTSAMGLDHIYICVISRS